MVVARPAPLPDVKIWSGKLPDLFPITDADKLAEVEREIKMREKVYRWYVEQGRMTHETADRQIAIMKAIAVDYRRKKDGK